jgi:hypothetical protein
MGVPSLSQDPTIYGSISRFKLWLKKSKKAKETLKYINRLIDFMGIRAVVRANLYWRLENLSVFMAFYFSNKILVSGQVHGPGPRRSSADRIDHCPRAPTLSKQKKLDLWRHNHVT